MGSSLSCSDADEATTSPVIGDQLRENVHSLEGGVTALAVGFVVALYGALGVTLAAQYTFNRV